VRRLAALALLAAPALLACGSSSEGTTGAPPAAWSTVLSGLDATLLSVWGTGPDDAFAVGGPLGNGGASALLRYDGAVWHDLAPGGTTTFWWAHGTGASDVWAVGEKGRIVHYDGSRLTEAAPATTATLYGVWAASPADVWAVGGTPGAGTAAPNDVVLHFDGAAWTAAALPRTLGRAYFKVWGTDAANVYVVGEGGTIWHRGGGAWALESSGVTATLLTVSGCGAGEVYAVGGRDVLRSAGDGRWTRVDVTLENDVNGVSCASPGAPAVVGFGGTKQRLVDGVWIDEFAVAPHGDLHGVWADGRGGFWAAGGDFVSPARAGARRAGVVAYYGSFPPAGTVAPALR